MTQKEIYQRLQEDFLSGDSGVSYLGASGVVAGILRAVSYVLATIFYIYEQTKRTLFLSTSTGTDLDRLGEERGIARESASAAGVVLSVYGTIGAILPINTEIRSSSGIVFKTTANVTIGTPFSGALPDIATAASYYALKSKVYAVAQTTGTVGNSPSKTIETFVGSMPAGITGVTNDFPSANGQDAETDTVYRARIIKQTAESERETQDFFYATIKNNPTYGDLILRTKAISRGTRETIVIIVRKDGGTFSAPELTTLATYIEGYCGMATTVICQNIAFTPVTMNIKIEKNAAITDDDEVYAKIADALSQKVDWSNWNWGQDIDDADLLSVCNIDGYVENIYLDEFYTHLDGGGLALPGDIAVTDTSIPRLISLTLNIYDPSSATTTTVDSTIEGSYEYTT